MDEDGDALIERLLSARERGRDVPLRVIAVIWTWLEARRQDLGSRYEKPSDLRSEAKQAPPFSGLTDDVLDRLRADPVREAALLLARVDITLARDGLTYLPYRTAGFDGTSVWVLRRTATLMNRIGGPQEPPSAQEHPSLLSLASTNVVCPVELSGIELDYVVPPTEMWERINQRLGRAVNPRSEDALTFHLDTLNEAGLTGWRLDSPTRGSYNPSAIDPDDEERCRQSIADAVAHARGPASILVFPELAATPRTLEALRRALREHRDAPLLTIVGLYHGRAADRHGEPKTGPNGAKLGTYLNEAVVLGPDGVELWRHRKLTSAGALQRQTGRAALEDIRLGRTVTSVPSRMGSIAVVICLDVIVESVATRLRWSGIDVLAVPSLSPTVRRHHNSVQQLVDGMWGIAFVCNRAPERGRGFFPRAFRWPRSVWNEPQNRSFWAIPKRGVVNVGPYRSADRPSFVYELGMKC